MYIQENDQSLLAEGHAAEHWLEGQSFEYGGIMVGSQEGASVAVSADGLTVVVGAPGADEESMVPFAHTINFFFPEASLGVTDYVKSRVLGAAYIWKFDESEDRWVMHQKLIPENYITQRIRFGYSVAISDDGNIIVVSGPDDGYWADTVDPWGPFPDIYGIQAHTGVEPDYTPEGVLRGYVAVGYYTFSPPTQMGTVWVYVKNQESGFYELNNILRSTFGGATLTLGGLFGTTVAISPDGTSIAVGDPTCTRDGVSGNVHIYTSEPGENSWALDAVLFANEAVGLGQSMSFAGNDKLVIGAPSFVPEISSFFVSNGTVWTAIRDGSWNLLGDFIVGDFGFGITVAGAERTMAAGSLLQERFGGTGFVQIYDWNEDSQSWQAISSLFPSGTEIANFFQSGTHVSLNRDGDILVTDSANPNHIVDIYLRSDSDWILTESLGATDAGSFGRFSNSGTRLTPHGGKIILGIGDNLNNTGGVWVFKGDIIPDQYWGSVINVAPESANIV